MTHRYKLTALLAILAVVAIVAEAPRPVYLCLELACLFVAGPGALGNTWRPLWWAGVLFVGLALALEVLPAG